MSAYAEHTALLSEHAITETGRIAHAFANALPFKHVVIDNFFCEEFARSLYEQFPSFDQRYAVDEYGQPSRKAVVESLKNLGSSYKLVDDLFGSPDFLNWVESVTGISGLIYNPDNYGGGTHENLEGQELLPHVDFNYHPATGHHRRLNLIIYLNPEWDEKWGGSIQIHSNPRIAELNSIASFSPIFNRCVMFETNEYSWHGFDRITLPDKQKGNSRKSLSLYLYTKERPDVEAFAPHGTFYIPRHLPKDFVAGKVLSKSDVETINYLLRTRDDLIALQQQREADREGTAAKLAQYSANISEMMSKLRLPILGYVKQTDDTSGIFPDRWVGSKATFSVKPLRPVTAISIKGRCHPNLPRNTRIAVAINGDIVDESNVCLDEDTVLKGLASGLESQEVRVNISSTATVNPFAAGIGDDRRDLSFHLYDIVFEHR